jgi:hypothetical protein
MHYLESHSEATLIDCSCSLSTGVFTLFKNFYLARLYHTSSCCSMDESNFQSGMEREKSKQRLVTCLVNHFELISAPLEIIGERLRFSFLGNSCER